MLKLTEHQERYDHAERKFLEREFRILEKRCNMEHAFFSSSLRKGGMEGFISYAVKSMHVLGQRIDLDCIDWESTHPEGLGFDEIRFSTLPWKKRIPGTKKWATHEHPDNIPGFGIKLNLLGWSWFFGRHPTMQELANKLNSGLTIEQIFNEKPREQGRGTTQFLTIDGERLSTSEALKKVGLFPQAYYSALKSMCKAMDTNELTEEVRQAVFDDMRKSAARKECASKGLRHIGGKWWVSLSDDGKNTLECLAAKDGVYPYEWLDNFLQYQ